MWGGSESSVGAMKGGPGFSTDLKNLISGPICVVTGAPESIVGVTRVHRGGVEGAREAEGGKRGARRVCGSRERGEAWGGVGQGGGWGRWAPEQCGSNKGLVRFGWSGRDVGRHQRAVWSNEECTGSIH